MCTFPLNDNDLQDVVVTGKPTVFQPSVHTELEIAKTGNSMSISKSKKQCFKFEDELVLEDIDEKDCILDVILL